METLRIAVFSWESMYSIRTGGLAPATTELAEALARRGNEVHFFTRRGEGQRAEDEINSVQYHRCSFNPGGNLMEYAWNMGEAMKQRFYAVEEAEGRFDVLHGHDWHVVDALAAIKREKNYPFLMTFHSTEYGRNGNTFGDWWEFREVSGKEWYGGYVSDRVTTVSGAMKEEIMRLYNIPDWKIDVVPNGINADKFSKAVDPGRVKEVYGIHPLAPVALYIGRMVMQKGPDLLLEAVPWVLAHRWDVVFIFAGDGDMRPGLEQRARELGIEYAVRFLGYVPDEAYIDLLNACDFVVMPSRNEPFGIVLLEAWSAGKLVIATDLGGPGENIDNFYNGIKVYPRPDSIAWGINYVVNDPHGVRWMGENGRKKAHEVFSWRKIAERYERIYKLR